MDWKKGSMPVIVVEDSGYPGVKKIAGKVAEDIHRVIGERPEVITEKELADRHYKSIILFATVGKSPLFDELVRKELADADGLYRETKDGKNRFPKREVYKIRHLIPDCELYGAKEILLICGSDKRGTIYGMFSLSEYIGVSPLCYWGDAEPIKRDAVHIGRNIEIISKEPTVRYRGFFINDEWPCFGTWVNKQFGGFNAEAYDKVFELLLRMKGNYLWPAMWSASFPLDGPGSANEELADLYGVVIGYARLIISDGDTMVAVDIFAKAVKAYDLPEYTFLPQNGVVTIGAKHFCRKKDIVKGKYTLLQGYGKYTAGLKVFPCTASFSETEDKPEVTYRFYLEEAGDYQVEIITSPFNSVVDQGSVNIMVQDSKIELLSADFHAGESSDERWAKGVLDQERRCSFILPFEKGVQELTLGALEAGVVLERILIHKPTFTLPDSYMGPKESCVSGPGIV